MPKDAIGNDVQEGNLVQVTLDSNLLRGRIKHIQSGGLTIPGSGRDAQQTPGMIVINTDILIPFNPKTPQVGNLIRIVDPEEKSIKDAVKM